MFSGLDGDADGEYLMGYDISTTASEYLQATFNGDTTTGNYIRQDLKNIGGSVSASNQTNKLGCRFTSAVSGTLHKGSFSLYAESGRKRSAKNSYSASPTSNNQNECAFWWNNTADNLTSMELRINDASSATGSVKLYRRKSNKTIDPVPMETLVEYDIAGVDFSAGITITGLQGDRINGAIKVEYVGVDISTDIRMQINSDTSSNYTNQTLYGNNSTATASSSTTTYFNLADGNGDVSYFNTWVYPNSGQNRPCLSEFAGRNNVRITKDAFWWNNTADEISSMKIYASNTALLTGTIRISVPKGTKMASPSAILTVN